MGSRFSTCTAAAAWAAAACVEFLGNGVEDLHV
jgi:hypothetical protein